MNIFRVYYYKADRTGTRLVGAATVSAEGCSERFPLAAKAFRHAPAEAKGATKISFSRVKTWEAK